MDREDKVISLETAKKLSELGVKSESEWWWLDWGKGKYKYRPDMGLVNYSSGKRSNMEEEGYDFISAYDVAELFDLFPFQIAVTDRTYIPPKYRGCCRLRITRDAAYYHCALIDIDEQTIVRFEESEESLAEAIAKIILWALKSKTLKAKDIG